MLSEAVNKTWAQLLHPTFRKVFIIGVLASLVTLVALNYTAYAFWPEGMITGIDWVDGYLHDWGVGDWAIIAMAGPAMIIVSYFLFPPIATAVMGLMNDDIVDAVEDEYYPHNKATRKAKVVEAFLGALKLALTIIFMNLLALIPYLILLFLSGGIGTLLLYLVMNGYLIGREYMEMVAIRHMPAREIKNFRKRHHSKFMTGGVLIVAMFLVPFLNIAAPIIGASIMTHIVQKALAEDKFGPR